MKKLLLSLSIILPSLAIAQPTDWQNFSVTGCDGSTKSIKTTLEETKKPIILMWKGYDCPFCRDEGAACATSAKTYGDIINYWSAFGRINGNATCNEATSWKNEYDDPATNFVFIDKLAEDNWSQPSPGQGRWYWVISIDKTTKAPRLVTNGNIIKDMETQARRATRDFVTANEGALAMITGLEVYPNPSSELMNIKLQLKSQANVVIQVKDMLGKTLEELANGDFRNLESAIDVSNYKKGIYMLHFSIDGMSHSKMINVN